MPEAWIAEASSADSKDEFKSELEDLKDMYSSAGAAVLAQDMVWRAFVSEMVSPMWDS